MASVKISELNELLIITSDDFLPLDDSGSMTTYRISIATLAAWLAASGSVISASYASFSNSASYARSASYAFSSSNSITASYSIISNNSYFSDVAGVATSSISSSYALTSSYALNIPNTVANATSSSYSISSSYSLSSSYSISSSYSLSSSNAETASNALTASYSLSTSPVIVPAAPALISGLRITPSWATSTSNPYADIDYRKIKIQADCVVAYNGSGESKVLNYVTTLIDRSLPSGTINGVTGSLDTGVFSPDNWYNIWIIYNSGTSEVSSIISNTGTSPSYVAPTLPSGFDYYVRVGTVKDSSTTKWQQWYEYGPRLRWFYRAPMPATYGTSVANNITHYFGEIPRMTQIRLKLKLINATLASANYIVGEEYLSTDFMADMDDNDLEYPIFGTAMSKTYFQIWRTYANHAIRSPLKSTGYDCYWGNGSTFFDYMVVAEL